MLKGFRDFLMRGNVVDLAVAVVIGTAFTGVVKAFTDGFINPLIATFGGTKGDGQGASFSLRHGSDAVEQSTAVLYGNFISTVVYFVIVAAVVYFLVVLPMNKLIELRKRGDVPEEKVTPEDILLLQEIRDLLRDRQSN